MIKQISLKHLGIILGIAIVLSAGFWFFSQWNLNRFRKSIETDTTQTSEKKVTDETSQQPTTITPSEIDDDAEKSIPQETDDENNEKEVVDNPEKDVEDASFYDFLDFLDELDEEEFAKLIESLDLEDDEKEAIEEVAEKKSEIAEDIHPSSMIVNFMESGVASLADLIALMEEATTVMPESVQEKFKPVMQTLQAMQTNGGGLIFHRPPEGSNFMLVFINPSPSEVEQMKNRPTGRMENFIHEIPSVGPNNESLFLHKGNSIIID